MTRERIRRLMHLAVPIIAAMASQNILDLVDTAMVGVLGTNALAAVGLGSFANLMLGAGVMGLASGVQAVAARWMGEGREQRLASALNGGLLLAAVFSVPVMLLVYTKVPQIFSFLHHDPAVLSEGVPYLRVRTLGLLALGMSFAFRGYWHGVHRSALYTRVLIVMHALNILLNYVFIYGKFGAPALGVYGAGLGSTIAIYCGLVHHMVLGWRHARAQGFLQSLCTRYAMRSIIQIGLPSSIQQLFFVGGLTALLWIAGKIGVAELAAANVLLNIMKVAILPGLGLGLATASLTGFALGQGNVSDATQWAWDVVKVVMIFMAVLGLPMVLLPKTLLGIFLHAPDALAVAHVPLQLTGAAIFLFGVSIVLQYALLGVGASRTVMFVSIGMQWVLFLPLAYLVGPHLGGGLKAVWVAHIVYFGLQSLVYIQLWRRGHWSEIRLA